MYKVHKEGTLPTNGEIFIFGSNRFEEDGVVENYVPIIGYSLVDGTHQVKKSSAYLISLKDKPLSKIKESIHIFLSYASDNIDTTFYVSGGFIGYKSTQIAPFFKDAGENVSLPGIFHNVITGSE